MSLSSEVIMPFGKYKDEMLMNIPRGYLEGYLLEQDWFEEKFPKLYKSVIEQLERRDSSHDDY